LYLKYEGAEFKIGLNSSLERHLVKQAIKKKIGKMIGKPYQEDIYLQIAAKILSETPEGIVVDVGSNIGTTILPLAVKFSFVKFFAIEPHPIPAVRLIRNCERNSVNNVNLLSVAVGLEEKMAQIYTCPTNSGGHRLTGFNGRADLGKQPPFGPINVPIKSLFDIFNEFAIKRCDLLKIDTEGYEVFVMESLKTKLQPNIIKHVIAEFGPEGLRQTGKSGWDLISIMLKQGYVCKILGTEEKIEHEKQVPKLADFSVVDLIFSPA
jgi:FkbM family methyltransferase